MRIVFASLGSLGDLHPLLAVAREARRRGHTPVIAASEIYRRYVGALGFEFRHLRPDFEPDPAVLEHLFHPQFGPGRLMREEIFGRVRETHADLLAACEGADLLVVGELLYVAPLVAAQRAIPWANVILAPTSFLSACDPCVLAPAPALHALRHLGPWPHRAIFALGRRVTKRWSAPLQRLRRELGMPPSASPVFDAKHSPLLVLALFPDFFAPPQRDWPARTEQLGFPFFAQPVRPEIDGKLSAFLAAGAPPIVFTFGSSVVHIAKNFYQAAVDAAHATGRRAILLLGKNPVPERLSDAVLALDYAPLGAVLPRAAAVVHQGGIGTCAEALRAGIPSLVIPFGFDQPDNAERLRRLGVAKVLSRRRVSAGTLAARLRAIASAPEMTRRARRLSEQIDADEVPRRSVDALERVAERPHLAPV